jgi:hypothetical protein
MSPYAQSLLDQMQTAHSEVQRAKAEILLGCYWARIGDQTRAEEVRQRSRLAYPSGSFGELTIMHMCLDGLMHFYADQSPAAIERLKSAHTLASTYRYRSEQSICAAWLAHVEFNRDHWHSMVEALRSGFASVDRSDLATIGRLSLVTADALIHSGEPTVASQWYEFARLQFTSIGDHAAIEAFIYNGAALRLHAARLSAINSPIDSAYLVKLGGEVASATNYQRLTQQRSLDYLLATAKASHQMLSGLFPLATTTISDLLEAGVVPKSSTSRPLLMADLALCHARVLEPTVGINSVEQAKSAANEASSTDDLAIIAHSIALACEALGLQSDRLEWMQRRDSALAEFRKMQVNLREELSEWMVDPRLTLFSKPN